MTQTALQALYQRFLGLCDAYAENPELLTGLALDEVVGQFRQSCVGELRDPTMAELLQGLLRAVSRGDQAEFHRLLDRIRGLAIEHDLA